MRLTSLTVENFRSITTARRIPIGNNTVLIGPNNEGKSNLLRALTIGLTELRILSRYDPRMNTSLSRVRPRPSRRPPFDRQRYDWDRDFPLRLQNRNTKKRSIITLDFQLNSDEQAAFRDEIKVKINESLPISLLFGEGGPEISIVKQGPGAKGLNEKAVRVARFVTERVQHQYIPAVRTAEAAQQIVDDLVAQELSHVENDLKYQQALNDIRDLQQPIIDELSARLGETMASFMPQLNSVELKIDDARRYFALRTSAEIFIDDGVSTPLYSKGDGVQSLAAIALMRHSSHLASGIRDQIIALEEPESHLHPSAIRELKEVIDELAKDSQIVMATHNPLFTNTLVPDGNIIVNNNRAVPAKSTAEVRNVLGVRLSDNLSSAETILIVEGEEDRVALQSIISGRSELLCSMLSAGQLVIDPIGGTGNLSHRIRLHSDTLCRVHVFLDFDSAGHSAFDRAKAEGMIDDERANFAYSAGKDESELEDLYDVATYEDIIKAHCGIGFKTDKLNKKKKWTSQLRYLLRACGKPHDDITVNGVKMRIAYAARDRGASAIHKDKQGPIDSLVASLEAAVLRK